MSFEAARSYLNMSKVWMYRLTREKKIPYYRPNGRRIYFIKRELNEWVMRNRIASEDEKGCES